MAYKIFIDQGHNPSNPNAGAEANGLREQDLVYEIGVLLAGMLNENPEFEAELSRNSPDTVLGTSQVSSLAARTSAANEWGADFFISVHANSSDIESAQGSEAFVYSIPSESSVMAELILENLSAKTGIPSRGVSVRPGLYVLRKTSMPALLLEAAFITNPAEAELMKSSPELFAEGIYSGITDYYALI